MAGGEEANDEALVKELLLAEVPLERTIELFIGRVEEREINRIARSIFSESNNNNNNSQGVGDNNEAAAAPPSTTISDDNSTPQSRGSLTGLGRSILARSKSAPADSNFMDSYISYLKKEAPDDFIDPIFLNVMNDPVVLSSGFVVDRDTVLDKTTGKFKFTTCPFTREKLKKEVYPLVFLKKNIINFKEKKIRPMMDAAKALLENNKIKEFIKASNATKDFISGLGEATFSHYEREVAEMYIDALVLCFKISRAESSVAMLPSCVLPESVAESFVIIWKGTPELHKEPICDEKGPNKKQKEFLENISILEQHAREAIATNQLDVASKWCDACDVVNKSCICYTNTTTNEDATSERRPISNLPVALIRLEIGRKRGNSNLTALKLSAYLEIQNNPDAVQKFCQDEDIDADELKKLIMHLPLGISGKSGAAVDSVTFTYPDGGKESIGGEGGGPGNGIKLDVGEILVAVEGFQFHDVDGRYLGPYIKFTTNRNREMLLRGNTNVYGDFFPFNPDPNFSIPDGKEIHEVQDPEPGYYYRFVSDEGIFGLRTEMINADCGKVVGVISLEERIAMASQHVPSGEYVIQNAKRGALFCSDNVFFDGDIWPFVAPDSDYANAGQERWHIQRQKDNTYKLRNGKHGGLFFAGDGTRYGPSEADNDGTHFAWVSPGPHYSSSGKELWDFERQDDGTYKLFNKKWDQGPLFCSDRGTMDGFFYAKTHNDRDYEDEGKERWNFQLISPAPLPAREDIVVPYVNGTSDDDDSSQPSYMEDSDSDY